MDKECILNQAQIDSNLKDAYELLNEYRNFNSVATIDNAAEMLDELIIKFHNSNINESINLISFLKTKDKKLSILFTVSMDM